MSTAVVRDSRPCVYTEGDYTVYRASSFGLPLRSLVAARLGHEPAGLPEPVRQAADEGTDLEPYVLELVMQAGYAISDQQQTVELVFPEQKAIIRGHIDAMADDGWEPVVLVCDSKTVSESGMIEFRRKGLSTKPSWSWQFSTYALAKKVAKVLAAVLNRKGLKQQQAGEEIPQEQVFQLQSFPVPFSLADFEKRLAVINAWVEKGELPLPERYNGWDPYAYLKPPAEKDEGLADLLAEYEGLNVTDKETAARKAELKEAIAFWMDGRPKVCAGGIEASLSVTETERLDTARFKRDHPELYQRYTTKSSSSRLVVKRSA